MKKQKGGISEEDNPLLFSARNKRNPMSMGSPRGPYNDMGRIIDYSKASTNQDIRRTINSFFENPRTDFVLKTINGMLSLLLVIQYIYSTYRLVDFSRLWWGVLSFLIHLYLLGEYVARLYSAKDFKKYLFSLESRTDIVSNIPFLVVRLASGDPFHDSQINILMRLSNLLTILRLLRLEMYQRYIVKHSPISMCP